MAFARNTLASALVLAALAAMPVAVASEPDRIKTTALGESPARENQAEGIARVIAIVEVARRGVEVIFVSAVEGVSKATVGKATAFAGWLGSGASVAQLGVEVVAHEDGCSKRRVSTPLTFDADAPAIDEDEIAQASPELSDEAVRDHRKPDFVPLFF